MGKNEYKGVCINSCQTYHPNFVDKTNALLTGGCYTFQKKCVIDAVRFFFFFNMENTKKSGIPILVVGCGMVMAMNTRALASAWGRIWTWGERAAPTGG